MTSTEMNSDDKTNQWNPSSPWAAASTGSQVSGSGLSSSFFGHWYGYSRDNWGESFFSRRADGRFLVVFYDRFNSSINEYSCSTIEVDHDALFETNYQLQGYNSHPQGLPRTSPRDFERARSDDGADTTEDFHQQLGQLAPELVSKPVSHMEVMTACQLAQYRRRIDNRAVAARARMSNNAERKASFLTETSDGHVYIHSGDLISTLADSGLFNSAIIPNWTRPLERSPRLVCYACGLEIMDMSTGPLEQHAKEKSCHLVRGLQDVLGPVYQLMS